MLLPTLRNALCWCRSAIGLKHNMHELLRLDRCCRRAQQVPPAGSGQQEQQGRSAAAAPAGGLAVVTIVIGPARGALRLTTYLIPARFLAL